MGRCRGDIGGLVLADAQLRHLAAGDIGRCRGDIGEIWAHTCGILLGCGLLLLYLPYISRVSPVYLPCTCGILLGCGLLLQPNLLSLPGRYRGDIGEI